MSTNTEKPSTKAETKKQAVANAPAKQEVKIDAKAKDGVKKETETKPVEKKKESSKPKVKKTEVIVNSRDLPISTKYSIAICKFILKKSPGDAIRDLEDVIAQKKAVPMNNLEVPHRKGKGIAGGRFPQTAAKQFITVLKSLIGNANVGDMDEPIITEAIANLASRPYGRFGRHKKKRTHLTIKAKEKKLISKTKSKKKSKK